MKIAVILLPAVTTHLPPVGLAAVAASIRSAGHQAIVRDLNIEFWSYLKDKFGASWNPSHPWFWDDQYFSPLWINRNTYRSRPLPASLTREFLGFFIQQIQSMKPDTVGFSICETNIRLTKHAAKMLKKHFPDMKIIIGGPSARFVLAGQKYHQFSPFSWLKYVDGLVRDEGELATPAILDWLISEKPPVDRRIFHKQMATGTRIIRAIPFDMNDYPDIDYRDISIEKYHNAVIPVEISRGCPAKCAFCAERTFHATYRRRPISDIIRTIEYNHRTLGHSDFSFACTAINYSHKYMEELVDGIDKLDFPIKWGASLRADTRISKELIRKMAKSGLKYLNFGLESASPFVLKAMNKPISPETAEKIIKLAYDEGIEIAINFITGFPGESQNDHILSTDFLIRNIHMIRRVHMTPCKVFRGATLAKYPSKYNIMNIAGIPVPFYEIKLSFIRLIFPVPWLSPKSFWVEKNFKNTHYIRGKRLEALRKIVDSKHGSWLRPFSVDVSREREPVNTD